MNRRLSLAVAAVAAASLSVACSSETPKPRAATSPSPSLSATSTASPSPSPIPSPSPSPRHSSRPPSPSPARTTAPSTAAPGSSATSSAPPSTTLPASLAGKVITRLPTQQKLVALTFDAGAGAQGAPAILAALAATGTPATFFLTGRFSEGNGALGRTIASRGYLIGNHSLTHPHFTGLSDAAVRIEVTGAAGDITAATGRDPRPWFRFPYGDYDARTLADVNALGYAAIGWTVDTLGWEGTSGGVSVNTVLSRVMNNLQPGEIVLMHVGANPNDGSTLDAQALPQIISSIRAAGYGFTTLSALAAGG